MVCSHCGKELVEAAVFCIYCGTPVAPLVVNGVVIERGALPPGKGCGIRSMFWGMVGWLVPLPLFLTYFLDWMEWVAAPPFNSLWSAIITFLPVLSPPSIVASIIYGIVGYNTEGRRYAATGLVLAVLYIMLCLSFLAFIMLEEIGYW